MEVQTIALLVSVLLSLLVSMSYMRYVHNKIGAVQANKKSELDSLKIQLYVMNKDYHIVNELDDMIDGEIVMQLSNIAIFSSSEKMTSRIADQISVDVFQNIKKFISDSFRDILALVINKDTIDEYLVRRIYVKVFEVAKDMNARHLRQVDEMNKKKKK